MTFDNQKNLYLGLAQVNQKPELVDIRVIASLKNIREAYRLAISLSGLDQAEVAKRLGLDAGRLSNIINADRTKNPDRIKHMPDEALAKLSKVLGNLVIEQYLAYGKGLGLVPITKTVEQKQADEIKELKEQLRAANA